MIRMAVCIVTHHVGHVLSGHPNRQTDSVRIIDPVAGCEVNEQGREPYLEIGFLTHSEDADVSPVLGRTRMQVPSNAAAVGSMCERSHSSR